MSGIASLFGSVADLKSFWNKYYLLCNMVVSKRNNLIDLLRFLAAISVALFHIYCLVNHKPDSIYTYMFFNYGKLGVPMFFVISGYCIMIALNHAKTSMEFIIRRLFRIFPPYWFSLFFTAFILFSLKLLRGANSVVTVPKTGHDILFTFSLLTYPLTKITVINWVYWTLPYEVLFYLAIFFCSFLKNNYFTLLLVFITVGSCVIPSTDFGFLSFFKFWPPFGIGAALFKILHDERSRQPINILLFCIALFSFHPAHQSLPFFIASMLTLVLIIISHYRPLMDNRVSQLGDISYSIYLIHVPLAVYCFGIYRELPLLKGNVFLNPLLDLVLLVIVIYISKAMYQYVELPSIDIGKRLSKILLKQKVPLLKKDLNRV